MASTINAKNTSTGVVITPDASGQLELQTVDTTRMTITSSGNVGIGTNSPANRLQITGAGGTSNTPFTTDDGATGLGLGINFVNNTSPRQVNFQVNPDGSGYTTRMTIDGSGNVGIGTTTPITTSARLSVRAAGDYDAGIAIGSNSSAANWARLDFKNTNVASPSIIYQDQTGRLSIRTDAAYPITFETNGASERMRITSNGGIAFGGASNFGTSGQVLRSNGDAAPSWVTPSSGFTQMAVFTSGSGTWTIPAGVTTCKITVVGGGGNGGNCVSTGGATQMHAGGGGGAGGASIMYYTGLTPGNTIAYTVGGAGGTSSVSSGTQTITTISATGGGAGNNGGAAAYMGLGGTGGSGSGGTLNLRGGSGGQGVSAANANVAVISGEGGNSIFGGGGASRWSSTGGLLNGIAGTNGGGGSGAYKADTGGSSGGAGASGVIVIEY